MRLIRLWRKAVHANNAQSLPCWLGCSVQRRTSWKMDPTRPDAFAILTANLQTQLTAAVIFAIYEMTLD